MATPVPPPSPRHLRLLRLLLSGLVLGAALRGAAGGRQGEPAPSAQAPGRPGAGVAGLGVGSGGGAVSLPTAALAVGPAGPAPPRPGRGKQAWPAGAARVPGGEPEVFVSGCERRSVSVAGERSPGGPAAGSLCCARFGVSASRAPRVRAWPRRPAGLVAGVPRGQGRGAGRPVPTSRWFWPAPRFAAMAVSEVSWGIWQLVPGLGSCSGLSGGNRLPDSEPPLPPVSCRTAPFCLLC